MDRQNRLVTGLLLVFLVLAAVVWFGEPPTRDAEEAATKPPSRVAFEGLKAEDVTRIVLRRASGELRFERTDGEWAMTAPRALAVEQRKVQEIADRFAPLELEDRSLTGTPESYGLDATNRVEVELAKEDGTTVRVFVGNDAPVGWAAYAAEAADGPAFVATRQLRDLAARGIDDFRSKNAWSISPGTARRVRIASEGREVILRKDDHGWWLGDAGPRADADAVDKWLGDASGAKVAAFLDDADPASVGLSPPASSLVVEDADGTHTLDLGPAGPDGAAARLDAGAPFRVDTAALALLDTTGWESPTLLPVRRAQIDRIDVADGDLSAVFVRGDTGWTREGGPAFDVEPILAAIEAARADRVATAGELGTARGRISLLEGADRRETVLLGEVTAQGRVAKDEAGGPTFVVPTADLDAILAAAR